MSQIEKNENSTVAIRPYKLKELAAMYGVDRKTFRKWLTPFLEKIGNREGHFYTISQVKIILEAIGYPSM
jgi:hypothetical protein